MFRNTFQSGFLSILYSIGYVINCALAGYVLRPTLCCIGLLAMYPFSPLFLRCFPHACAPLCSCQEQAISGLGQERCVFPLHGSLGPPPTRRVCTS